MPIYAYRCTNCGHAQDVLRKISDPPLNVCPACGAATFVKQVTAAGFQLKGSGWYVTDFRGDKKTAKSGDADAPSSDAKPADGAATPANGKDAAKGGTVKSEAAAPAPAPAAAPAAAPTTTTPAKGDT
jgi:putative FmdB family regulatory protein